MTLRRLAAATLLSVALLLAPAETLACPSTGCLLANRSMAGLMSQGQVRVDFSFRHIDQSRLLEGISTTDQVRRPWIDFRDGQIWPAIHDDLAGRQQFAQVDLEYGLTDRTVLFVSAPLISSRRFSSGDEYCGLVNSTSGIGDVLVGGRRSLKHKGSSLVVATAALKLPTGKSRTLSCSGATILDPMFQSGSGSIDVLGSVLYTFKAVHPSLDWSALTSYQATSVNGLGFRFGNQSIAALTTSRRVKGPLAVSLQMKALHQSRSLMKGTPLASSGAISIVLTPGVRYAIRGSTLYSAMQLPILTYVNETQLSSRYGLLLGVSRTFALF